MLKKDMFIKLLAILMCFVLLSSNFAFALTDPDGGGNPDGGSAPVSTTSGDMGSQYQTESQKYQNGEGAYGTIKSIANTMFLIAFAVAVFKLIQIGIGFLTGSGKSRQDAKMALIPWVIGVMVCALYFTVGDWIIRTLTGGLNSNIFG
ncbi:MAG: hypothetical protein IKR04_01095 [Clostridia bacterium]|nr:hypothetical protein [Clostridia bacterium]